MTKSLRVLGLLALVAMLSASVSYAVPKFAVYAPVIPNVSEGELYDRDDIWPDREFLPTSLPTPIVTEMGLKNPSTSVNGPTAESVKADLSAVGGGSAIPGMRGGGSFVTPKMRADRQIKRMVRALN